MRPLHKYVYEGLFDIDSNIEDESEIMTQKVLDNDNGIRTISGSFLRSDSVRISGSSASGWTIRPLKKLESGLSIVNLLSIGSDITVECAGIEPVVKVYGFSTSETTRTITFRGAKDIYIIGPYMSKTHYIFDSCTNVYITDGQPVSYELRGKKTTRLEFYGSKKLDMSRITDTDKVSVLELQSDSGLDLRGLRTVRCSEFYINNAADWGPVVLPEKFPSGWKSIRTLGFMVINEPKNIDSFGASIPSDLIVGIIRPTSKPSIFDTMVSKFPTGTDIIKLIR